MAKATKREARDERHRQIVAVSEQRLHLLGPPRPPPGTVVGAVDLATTDPAGVIRWAGRPLGGVPVDPLRRFVASLPWHRAVRCGRCDDCGQIASGAEGAPWSAWLALPEDCRGAVAFGGVRPVPCPACRPGEMRKAPEPKPRSPR